MNQAAEAFASYPKRAREALVTAEVVAEHFGVTRSWVYEHADELDVIRLGNGPKARLRFDLERAVERLTCSGSRGSVSTLSGSVERRATRRRRPSLGRDVPLLPIRGSNLLRRAS